MAEQQPVKPPVFQDGFRHYLDDVVAQFGKASPDTKIPLESLQELQASPENAFRLEAPDAQLFQRLVFEEFGGRGHITQEELMDRLFEMQFTPTVAATPAPPAPVPAPAGSREPAPAAAKSPKNQKEGQEPAAPRPAPTGRGFALPSFGGLRKKPLSRVAEVGFEHSLARTREFIGKTNSLLSDMPTMSRQRQELATRQLQKMVAKINKDSRQLAKVAEKSPGNSVIAQGMDTLKMDLQSLDKSIDGSPVEDASKSKMREMLKELAKAISMMLAKIFNNGATPQPA